jgi:hypothetical protein
MKSKEFRIQENRLLFKCPFCGRRRNYTILNLRRKTIKCCYCQEMTRCIFNRRPEQREAQSGLLSVKTREGKEIIVMMRDKSSRGIGFEIMKGKDARRIKKGQEVSLSCNWSPAMIPKARFRVQNISGFRVGVMVKRK